jgi:HEAT repeat protein
MRRLAAVAAFALVVSVPGLTRSACAHGGSYRGPAGEVPPDSRVPDDPPPPAQGDGPQTPPGDKPGGPTTGGDAPGGTSTEPGGSGTGPGTGPGNGGPQNGGGPAGGPTTAGNRPGGKRAAGLDWRWWWANNKDEILQVKSAVRILRRGPVSRGSGRTGAVTSVTDEAIQSKIVPALRALLADTTLNFHIRSAAELGLAKIGDTSIVPTLRSLAADRGEVHREVRETAALSLGILQERRPETRSFLAELVRDPAIGGSFARPFAAISLGLLADPEVPERATTSALLETVGRRNVTNDLRAASLVGVGLTGDPDAVPELLAIVRNARASAPGAPELDDTTVSYAVAALARSGRPGLERAGEETCVVDELFRLLDERSRVGLESRRSAAIGLGRVAPHCSPRLQLRAVGVLETIAERGSDEEQRHFATMSLGRLGAAKQCDAAVRARALDVLGRAVEKAPHADRAFAALALSLVGRGLFDECRPVSEEQIRAPLLRGFEEVSDPAVRGAFALASGLVRNPLAVPRLLATLEDTKESPRVRGWCALALGLIGARNAASALRDALAQGVDHELRVHAATAAGLLQDGTVEDALLGVLAEEDPSNYELGSAAGALGILGDEKAIDALLDLAMDRENRHPLLPRALAVVALGQIGDRRNVPTLARVATDVNYRAAVPAITELLSIL